MDLALVAERQRDHRDRAVATVMSPVDRLLTQAASEACAAWATTSGSPIEETQQEHATRLARIIRRAAGGTVPRMGELLAAIPSLALLSNLRQAFLAAASAESDRISTADLLGVLGAIELVSSTLEGDPVHRVVNQLGGSQALELLVEVAHDMRSPLGAVLLLVDTLRRGHSGEVTPVQERQLALVYSAAFGLSALANDVMEVARGGEGLLEREPVPFSVVEVLASVQDLVRPVAEEKGLALHVGRTDATFRVGHPAAIRRVLLNLATNAVKHSESGMVEIGVRSRARTTVEFFVRDTGSGLPADVAEAPFDAFRRRRGGGHLFSSTGLGLAICRRLVDAMGGSIRVEETGPDGTCIAFELELEPGSRV